jgi:hypothetical protein
MGTLPPVSPLPSCQNVSFGGIIPYIAQKNFWGKNDPFPELDPCFKMGVKIENRIFGKIGKILNI